MLKREIEVCVLKQPGSELLSMAPLITDGCVDAWGLVNHLSLMLVSRSHAAPGAILIWVTCTVTGAMVMTGPKLLQRYLGQWLHCSWSMMCMACPVCSMVSMCSYGTTPKGPMRIGI